MMRRLSLLLAGVLAFGLVSLAAAQQQDQPKAAPNPLVQLLQTKGVLTAQEAAAINQAATPAEQQQRLSELLYSKGIITQDEYKQTAAAEASVASSQAALVPASASVSVAEPEPSMAAAPQKPAAPPVIPAVAPIRALPTAPFKPGGIAPTIKLGAVSVHPYGFLKSTAAYDTSNQQGNDFPLPGFLGDTGPDGSPEFHLKARQARFGAFFGVPDLAGSKNAVTGRIEFDFEGNFTRTNNRNISSVRSSTPSLRLAWIRIDHHVNDLTSVWAQFGQDWTPFASSTLPNLLETTGLGISFGSLYERAPQFRFGVMHNFGGSRHFTVVLEPAIALPAFGITPADLGNQLGYGERQGVDSQRPEVQGRVVLQFQVDKAKGVAPAQIIFSGMNATRRAIVLRGQVPASVLAASNGSEFARGATFDSDRWGGTAELQLPTRYATLIAKYWSGNDLRWYFSGELYTPFNDRRAILALDPAATIVAASNTIDGSTIPQFAILSNGTAVQVPQFPVRAVGGFAQLSFPLSRIFNANPEGRNAGWTMAFTYGIDQAKARDVRFIAPTGSRLKSDMAIATLMYKFNKELTFGYETSYYRTRSSCSAAQVLAGTCGTLFRGEGERSMHDVRFEFGPTLTF
jgi:hypothetical protein